MNKTVLLYSGGMDSWLINEIEKPDVKLYVDINGSYNKDEIKHLPSDVIIEKLDLSKWEREDSIVPLRNLYFVMVAAQHGNNIILGATAGDRVLDKSHPFAKKASDLLSYLYQEQHWTNERNINVLLPYKDMSKDEILRKYVEQGGNLERAWNESFSCYNPHPETGEECWKCKPCYRKFVAFWVNGYTPPHEVTKKWLEWVFDNKYQLNAEMIDRGEKELSKFKTTVNQVVEKMIKNG